MLIQINTSILTTAQDLILVQNFYLQKEAMRNMSVDSEGKDIVIFGEGPKQELDDKH